MPHAGALHGCPSPYQVQVMHQFYAAGVGGTACGHDCPPLAIPLNKTSNPHPQVDQRVFKRLVCEHFPHLTEYLEGLGADVSCVFVQVGWAGGPGEATAGSVFPALQGRQLSTVTYPCGGGPLSTVMASSGASPYVGTERVPKGSPLSPLLGS